MIGTSEGSPRQWEIMGVKDGHCGEGDSPSVITGEQPCRETREGQRGVGAGFSRLSAMVLTSPAADDTANVVV